MLRLRLNELVEKKSRVEGRKITISKVADEVGISRSTLSKILNSPDHRHNSLILDKLCDYFELRDANEILEIIPNKELRRKELSSADVKANKKILMELLPEYFKKYTVDHKIIKGPIKDIKTRARLYSYDEYHRLRRTRIDMIITDADNKILYIDFMPRLQWGFDKNSYDIAIANNPDRILLFTCTHKVPKDLIGLKRLELYYTRIIFNQIDDVIVDISLERLDR